MDAVCRICTCSNVTLVNIFAKREQLDQEPPLVDMLNECANCETNLNDPLPQNICLSCTLAAQSAFRFKRRCEESYQYFWQLLTDQDKKPLNCEVIVPEDGPVDECTFYVVDIKEEVGEDQEPQDLSSVDWDNAEEKEASSTTSVGERQSDNEKDEKTSPIPKKKSHPCGTCGKLFKSQWEVNSHMRFHTRKRPYKCTHCSMAFHSSSTCKMHMRLHTGERPFECRLCKKTFVRKDDLKRHIFKHTGERPYKCSHCFKGFVQRSILVKHMRTHTKGADHQCPHCPKLFTNTYGLKIHIRIHTGERPFKCPECPKAFVSRDQLTRHTRTHTGLMPYQCLHCFKSFISRSDLNRHSKIHAVKTTTVDHLKRHLKKRFSEQMIGEDTPQETQTNPDAHEDIDPSVFIDSSKNVDTMVNEANTKENNSNYSIDSINNISQKAYKCGTCEESFTTKRDFTKHKCANMAESLFTCGQCSKIFRHKGHFVRHIGLHEKKYPYECLNCPSSFKTKRKLAHHVCDEST